MSGVSFAQVTSPPARHTPWPHRHGPAPEAVAAKVVAFLIVCVLVALFAGGRALLADAAHMLTDDDEPRHHDRIC